jgi:hypothetical protein
MTVAVALYPQIMGSSWSQMWVLASVLVAEIVLTLWDFVVERSCGSLLETCTRARRFAS